MLMTLLADPPTGFDDGTATPTFGLSAPFLAAAFSMLLLVLVLVSRLASGWMPRALTARVYLPLSVLVVLLVIFDLLADLCHLSNERSPRNPGFWGISSFPNFPKFSAESVEVIDGDGDDAVTGQHNASGTPAVDSFTLTTEEDRQSRYSMSMPWALARASLCVRTSGSTGALLGWSRKSSSNLLKWARLSSSKSKLYRVAA